MATDFDTKPEAGFLKVSSKSSPASVAGAIAGMVKDGVEVEIQSVGAGAVNQAVKAIAISRGFLSPIVLFRFFFCFIQLFCSFSNFHVVEYFMC